MSGERAKYECPVCGLLPHWSAVVAVANDGCSSGGAPQLCPHCGRERIMHERDGCHAGPEVVALSITEHFHPEVFA